MAISDLSKEQIEQYAKESTNWKELMTKCGYTNFGCRTYLKKKLELFDINISHFIKTKSSKKYSDEETLNMVQIGKKYNVTDNTIRKWIKKYQNINNIIN